MNLLGVERWDEYDPTVTAACHTLAVRSLAELRKVAKAIALITPDESRDEAAWTEAATKRIVADEPWFHGVLDSMK